MEHEALAECATPGSRFHQRLSPVRATERRWNLAGLILSSRSIAPVGLEAFSRDPGLRTPLLLLLHWLPYLAFGAKLQVVNVSGGARQFAREYPENLAG